MLDFFCGIKDFLNKVKRIDFSDLLSCGVTSAEYAFLDIMADKMESGDRDFVWVSEITDEVPVTAQAVSKSLKALEQKGYIERFANEKGDPTSLRVLNSCMHAGGEIPHARDICIIYDNMKKYLRICWQ